MSRHDDRTQLFFAQKHTLSSHILTNDIGSILMEPHGLTKLTHVAQPDRLLQYHGIKKGFGKSVLQNEKKKSLRRKW